MEYIVFFSLFSIGYLVGFVTACILAASKRSL